MIPPAEVIGAEETNILGGLSESKGEKGDPRLLRRPRQTEKKHSTHNCESRDIGDNCMLHRGGPHHYPRYTWGLPAT